MKNYKEMYEKLLAEFEQYKKESIKWNISDFLCLNSEVDDAVISLEQAQAALEDLIRNHDASLGIAFDDVREMFYRHATPIGQVEERFPRYCSVTGEGMYEGYVIGGGDMYFKYEKDLIEHLRSLDWEDCNGNNSQDCETDEELLEFFYAEEYYYWTEWSDEDIDDEE